MKNKEQLSNMKLKAGIGLIAAPIFAYFLSTDQSGTILYAPGFLLSTSYGIINGYHSLQLQRSCKKHYGSLWLKKKEDLLHLLSMSLNKDVTVTGTMSQSFEEPQDTYTYQKTKSLQ